MVRSRESKPRRAYPLRPGDFFAEPEIPVTKALRIGSATAATRLAYVERELFRHRAN